MLFNLQSIMKNFNIIFLAFIVATLNACLVKEPEPRQPTIISKSNTPVNDNLPFTEPSCQVNQNSTRGNYVNFNITYSSVIKTQKSASITQIYATNANNDVLIILINNFKNISANYNIVPQINIGKNEAYIEMEANALSLTNKTFLESGTGILHVFYNDVLEEWTVSFCDFKFNYFGTPPVVNGKFLVN